ncbi:MAG: Ig-like domain-containing protein [Terriglobia bacterium]
MGVLLATLVITVLLCAQNNPITFQYFYDDAHQLTKVVDSSGNIVTYKYDPVGNISSISRTTLPSAVALAIFDFTPQRGPVRTTVTIQGQGFSTTSSQNTVQFNGVSTTVVHATATSLVVTAPSGATTGPISVTVGGVTATSDANFTVIPPPSISSIRPTAALAGTGVPNLLVTGASLTGATFAFSPSGFITVGSASASPDGTSATLGISIGATAQGSFALVASNLGGSSSAHPGPNNTLIVPGSDPNADPDKDGLTNAVEIAIGTNPLNANTDGDGISDGWAVFYGFSPLDPSVASTVAPDGLTNLQNYQNGHDPHNPDLVPPSVAKITPANGASNVFLNDSIVIRFAEPLLAGVSLASAQNALTAAVPAGSISDASLLTAAQVLQSYMQTTCCGNSVVPGVVTVKTQQGLQIQGKLSVSNDGLSVVFTPLSNWPASTTFNVQVNGLRDVAGNKMTRAFTSSFTTGQSLDTTAPSVVGTSPPNNATDVPVNAPFRVQFSSVMNPATLIPANFVLEDEVTYQSVPGMVQVDSTGVTAAFVPNQPLAVGRWYIVSLSINITDVAGNPLSALTTFSFTTAFAADTTSLHLSATSPANGSTSVPLNSWVLLQFNRPLDPLTVQTGISLSGGGQLVAGSFALSNGNSLVTFTHPAALMANTTYTLTTSATIVDLAGYPLDNAGNIMLQTGAASDTTPPQVVMVSPASNATGVPTNTLVELRFSKPIDPLTVTSGTFTVYPQSTFIANPGMITVAADGMSATFTPTTALAPLTSYYIYVCGITDLVGQQVCDYFPFTTAASAQTTGPAVVAVSPPSGASGAPVNAWVVVQLSGPINPISVGNNAITVSGGGGNVAGAITVSTDLTTLTFKPTNLLTASTTYTVGVSGFTDLAGNTVAPFTGSFGTGTSGVPVTTGPSVVSVPVNGATSVPVNTSIVLTFSEAVDPITVNSNSIPISVNGVGAVAGKYAVNGAVVTFTPLTPLPGNVQINITVNGFCLNCNVTDLAGNASLGLYSSFTTAPTADTTAPRVISVTPNNGATNIGLNAAVVLIFSKSLNPSTINNDNFGLLANGTHLNGFSTVSADNRTVTVGGVVLPASSAVTVVVTNAVQDLSGNHMVEFRSQFTTAAALDSTHPSVVSQRPGNGASGASLASNVFLFVNEPMNQATIPSALHVSQNGIVANGTVKVTENGQVILFQPASPWQANALVQVFLDSTAQDADGNSLSSYQGSFRTMVDTTIIPPTVVSTSPALLASNVPLNPVLMLAYNEPLDPATVNASTVLLMDLNGNTILTGVSLDASGELVSLAPNAPLAANTNYFFQTTTGINGVNGLAQNSDSFFEFTTGISTDTVNPVVTSVAPPDGSTNLGDNASIRVRFSKPIDPLTVSGTTIQVMGGGSTVVPSSISFSNSNQDVLLVPQAPLPDNTPMTIAVSGVQDLAGNAVIAKTTQFATGPGPDLIGPAVISENPFNNATNVPLNAPISLQTSEPIDPPTVNSNTLGVFDFQTAQQVAGSYSVSANAQTLTFVPSSPLAPGQGYLVDYLGGIMDLEGNLLSGPNSLGDFFFTTGNATDTAGPQVLGVSPPNGLTGVPINAQVVIQFDKPVDSVTMGQVTLSGGGGNVNVIPTLSNGNQTLTLSPVLPLTAVTAYTVTVAGVQGLNGVPMTAMVTTTFTTGTDTDLTPPQVVTVNPANGATGVPTNTSVKLQFSKRIDLLTVTSSTLTLSLLIAGPTVAGSLTATPDGLTATFTPNSALTPSTTYWIESCGITDLVGQGINCFLSYFTTGTQ